MARGRMVSQDIARDKKINDLSDDTSRLAFTWLITFADCEGRTYGDPAMVRSMLFPRRADVTVEQMERYISEWHAAGLVVWYAANDDLFIEFPSFDKHQVGLRKDREPASNIPAPSVGNTPNDDKNDENELPEDIRQTSGELTEDIPVKLIKEKLIKNEDKLINGSEAPKTPPPTDEPPKPPTQQQEMVRVLSAITGMDYKIKTNAGRLAKRGAELIKAGYEPEQVESLYSGENCYWYSIDWRGKQKQKPKPEDILETIGAAAAHWETRHGRNGRTSAEIEAARVKRDAQLAAEARL